MRKAKFKTRQSQKLPSTVWWVGLSMCLVNTSFVMIFGISAVYLHSLMGVAVGWILVLEGLGEAASFLMKLFSGVISDYIHKRKPIILIGYGLILISKFILALSRNSQRCSHQRCRPSRQAWCGLWFKT
jgi:MFS family permease